MYEHRNIFFNQISKIFGQIVFAHMRANNITFYQLQSRVDKLGYKCTYHGLYQSVLGNNTRANNLFYWQRIFEALNIQLDVHTFAQTLQESQVFNAEFKAKKKAKIEENKRNKQK